MHWSDFSIGFWHPFGVHADESPECILERKRDEINRIGWTLWSFQWRKSLDAWRDLVAEARSVFVLCSDSPGAQDPKTKPTASRFYRAGHCCKSIEIPDGIAVPHPANRAGLGSAFVVEQVLTLNQAANNPAFGIEWLQMTKTKEWRRHDPLPTRGEYLIRTPGPVRLRPIYAVLRLRAPFLVEISNCR